MFMGVNVYCGKEFRLSIYVVGYNFGTTVGSDCVGFLYSRPSARLSSFQDQQYYYVNTSKECSNLT